MTAKEFLSLPKVLKAEIACDTDNLAAMRAVLESCTHQLDLAGVRASACGRGKLEDLVAEIAEEEQKLNDKIARCAEAEKEVLAALRLIPDARQRTALLMRYVANSGIEEIAERMGICSSMVYRFMRKGLKSLEKMIEKE